MNLKACIGKLMVRTKPFELSEGFWEFSFMDRPIFIVDVGVKNIYYKYLSTFSNQQEIIHTIDIKYNDKKWIVYNENKKEEYRNNQWKWHDIYEKRHPEEIKLIRQSY